MEDIKYFKDMLESIHEYRKINLLIFIIKKRCKYIKGIWIIKRFYRKIIQKMCKSYKSRIR